MHLQVRLTDGGVSGFAPLFELWLTITRPLLLAGPFDGVLFLTLAVGRDGVTGPGARA